MFILRLANLHNAQFMRSSLMQSRDYSSSTLAHLSIMDIRTKFDVVTLNSPPVLWIHLTLAVVGVIQAATNQQVSQ